MLLLNLNTKFITYGRLHSLFTAFGRIDQLKYVQGETHAFVTMNQSEDAEFARRAFNGADLWGNDVSVRYVDSDAMTKEEIQGVVQQDQKTGSGTGAKRILVEDDTQGENLVKRLKSTEDGGNQAASSIEQEEPQDPQSHDGSDSTLQSVIKEYIDQNKVMIFSETTCPYCQKVKQLFQSLDVDYKPLELDTIENGVEMQQFLLEMFGQKTVPNVFIGGQHVGGCDSTLKLHAENRLLPMIRGELDEGRYEFDLIVIGGGSGGLAAAKEASALGAKVACLDFVKPSPQGTTWGLGGTCVNVGCIPKKLMHQAALLEEEMHVAHHLGWDVECTGKHNWQKMTSAIQDHLTSLSWECAEELRTAAVTYINAFAEFAGPHKIKSTDAQGQVTEMTSQHFIIATGGRPRYLDIPGSKEFCISSDDLFSLPYCPGKTLIIGASVVSLECAGILKALGLDVTVMVRSNILHTFDQQMAELIGDSMKNQAIQFMGPCVPTKVEMTEEGQPGSCRVTAFMEKEKLEVEEVYNTVMMAVGRDPCTSELHLENVGVKVNPKSGYIICGEDESTSCPYVFAVGDVVEGRPALSPLATKAGILLAKRLFGGATLKCDYVNIPTTVFTPLEYGCVGLSEEDALAKYGPEDIQVYHSYFTPLEWTVPLRDVNDCYAKLICVTSENEKVVGLHVLGPNAGEITQGWTIGIKLGATKADFDNAIGIHPTCAEVFTTLSVSKNSGVSAVASG